MDRTKVQVVEQRSDVGVEAPVVGWPELTELTTAQLSEISGGSGSQVGVTVVNILDNTPPPP